MISMRPPRLPHEKAGRLRQLRRSPRPGLTIAALDELPRGQKSSSRHNVGPLRGHPMQHPCATLAPEYAALLAAMRLDPAREHELAARAAAVLALSERHRDEWAEVASKTGVPRLWGLASFERESGSDYSRSPAQGDRWERASVHGPRGLGPYRCWGDACVTAYRIDRLDGAARGPRAPPATPPPAGARAAAA